MLSGEENSIFIGQHDFLMQLLSEMENGIYIGKNIFHKRSDVEKGEIYQKLKKKGFDIIYLHEEGAVFRGDAENWKKVLNSQYNLDFFDERDIVCDWGGFQKEYDESRSKNLKIEVTGHPRFDLYKEKWKSYFQKEIDSLKKEYGNYVLINGNYSSYNHGLGLEHVLSDKSGYNPIDEKQRLERMDFLKYSGNQCLAMIQLTHQLSVKYPALNFIYRPHPSENQSYYETFFNGVKNIKVKHDGSVSAWIFAAEAIIHDGCTTAIEASLAGKPVINFKPIKSKKNDIWLPNQLGVQCVSFEEVTSVVDNLSQFKFDIENVQHKELIQNLMYNFGNDSYKKLIDIIESKLHSIQNKKYSKPSKQSISKENTKLNIKKNLYRLKSKETKKKFDYHNRKFYGFDKDYIEEKIKTLEVMFSKKIDYQFHNSQLIEIR